MATADMAEQLEQFNIRHGEGEIETQLKEEQGKEQGRLSGIVDQHDVRLTSQEATIREGFSDLNARLDKMFAVIIAGFLVIFGTIITVALSAIDGQ